MNCPACKKEVMPDSFFCSWCDDYMSVPGKGRKANLFARWVALVLDPLIGILLWLLAPSIFGSFSRDLGVAMAVLFPLIYGVFFLVELRKGRTPGKRLLGLQVVQQQNGEIPGFGKMFIREVVGRFVSGVVLGLGYLWAIFDKNSQAWHDKIAGTVVIKV